MRIALLITLTLFVPTALAGGGLTCGEYGTFAFADDEVAVNEALDEVTLLVERAPGSDPDCAADIDWATSEDSAAEGDDYEAASGTLSFPYYTDQMALTVPLRGDACREASESFRVALTSTEATIGATDIATVVIVDDDPEPCTVRFSTDQYEAAEGDGVAVIRIVRTGPLGSEVRVDYGATASTATPSDFAPQGGTAVLGPGEASVDIALEVLDDAVEDGSKTVSLTLARPAGGAYFGSPRTSTLTIFDDDPPPALISSTETATDTTTETATDMPGSPETTSQPSDTGTQTDDMTEPSPFGFVSGAVLLLAVALRRR